MHLVSRKLVDICLGEGVNLMIDPNTVQWYVGTKRPLKSQYRRSLKKKTGKSSKKLSVAQQTRANLLGKLHPFILNEDQFPTVSPIDERLKFIMIKDFIDHRNNFQESIWYRNLVHDLQKNGYAKHKRMKFHTTEDIDEFFLGYVFTLMNSLEQNGYDTTINQDVGTAMIGKKGEICKSASGAHRFAFARYLKVPLVPVRIVCVHSEWLESMGISTSVPQMKRLRNAMKDVESQHR